MILRGTLKAASERRGRRDRTGRTAVPAGSVVPRQEAPLTTANIKTILYITYDGLTDFLGQSQVLPYLLGCARAGHRITVISFEKEDRERLIGNDVRRVCDEAGIVWLPQRFRTSPPYLSKLLDHRTMYRVALATARREQFDLVHCRSYPAAVVGLALKKRFGLRLLFDMRGFWPDARREGGRWRESSPLGRYLYWRWKRHEAALLGNSDHIVSLTCAASSTIREMPGWRGAPISTIPCCADFETFRLGAAADRLAARRELDIDAQAPVLVYIGSLGTVYLLGEQLRLFDAIRRRHPGTQLLYIGNNSPETVLAEARRRGIALARGEFRMIAAERARVSYWAAAGDVGLCFCMPTFSCLGVSPTKMAEYLACGIPLYGNRGVGDVELILERLQAGHVLPNLSDASIEAAAADFDRLRRLDRGQIRADAREMLDLPAAVAAYRQIYADLDGPVELLEP